MNFIKNKKKCVTFFNTTLVNASTYYRNILSKEFHKRIEKIKSELIMRLNFEIRLCTIPPLLWHLIDNGEIHTDTDNCIKQFVS